MAGIRSWLRRLTGGRPPAARAARRRPTRAVGAPGAIGALGGDGTPSEEGANAFALDLHCRLRQQGGNLCFSPASIRAALAMVLEAARGETAAQIERTLRLHSSDSSAAAAAGPWRGGTAAANPNVHVANSLWVDAATPLLLDFVDRIAERHGGTVNTVDFRHHAGDAAAAINRWVEEATRGKITDLVPRSLSPLTRLVLANAIHFKADWAEPFSVRDTVNQPFHREGGGTVQAPFMRAQIMTRYARRPDCQAVELNYERAAHSMVVVLPDQREGLWRLEETLSARTLHDIVAGMGHAWVDLSLPRFRIAGDRVDLRDPLAAAGMPLPFDAGRADLSGANDRVPPDVDALHLDFVFHRAFIDVDETGTEAAGATGAGMITLGISRPRSPRLFRADHPFLFAIRDRRANSILFLGRVADPSRSA